MTKLLRHSEGVPSLRSAGGRLRYLRPTCSDFLILEQSEREERVDQPLVPASMM